jgi:uncharacterized phage protein (TIGR02216 family)
MHAAFATLRLTPSTFWSLSLPEWRALTTPPRAAALSRASFESLMAEYPDLPGT